MSRYFFHLRRGRETVSDNEGDEFPSDEAARMSAVSSVREMVAALIKSGRIVADEYMDVSDDAGTLLFSVSFHDVVQNHLKK
ncbi:DUF6894 family protein [Agrobacterium sp.]|jgi:hypothetical protein|uniref:DUF6894 family protein n=1 Tax=Agrobacterium sp. TaxID=361 RepID=UPI0028A6A5FE|nr:hypothetical protein [Agrobacterium sp.]